LEDVKVNTLLQARERDRSWVAALQELTALVETS